MLVKLCITQRIKIGLSDVDDTWKFQPVTLPRLRHLELRNDFRKGWSLLHLLEAPLLVEFHIRNPSTANLRKAAVSFPLLRSLTINIDNWARGTDFQDIMFPNVLHCLWNSQKVAVGTTQIGDNCPPQMPKLAPITEVSLPSAVEPVAG